MIRLRYASKIVLRTLTIFPILYTAPASLANLTIGFSFRWYASQEWLADQYIADAGQWGVFDEDRWNGFYGWRAQNGLTTHDLSGKGFSNEYLPQE